MRVTIGKYPSYNKKTKKTPERKISVKIDKWDVWSMDHTLAIIILPMLKELKKVKHGAPNIDIVDVPKNLRMTAKQKAKWEKTGNTDPKFFKRWDWILDEMIWAFEQILDDNADDQFHTGEMHHLWQPMDKDQKPIGDPVELSDRKTHDKLKPEYWRMVQGPNHTFKTDRKGLQKHYDRITNGTTLFGKYYQSLWD
jgi:hypothetical protein